MRAFVLSVVVLCGCGNYHTDLENFCNAAERSGVKQTTDDAATKARIMGTWLEKNIHSSEGKALFARVGPMPREAGDALVREEAAKAGVAPCPFRRQ